MAARAEALTEEQILALTPQQITERLTANDTIALAAREKWLMTARPKQVPPKRFDWETILWMSGRGFGKSRTISEACWWEGYRYPNLRLHMLAPTLGDVRGTCFEGQSGLLSCIPRELIQRYRTSPQLDLTLVNGTQIRGFSVTEEADRLRGPQCHAMFFDEAAAADRPAGNLEAAFKVAELGCRLPHPDGKTPARVYVTTTPRPITFLRKLIKRPKTIVVRGTSYENLKNLSPTMVERLLSMEGTAFARQELHGEILDSTENAIFQRNWFRLWPNGKKLPEFAFILVSVDPAVSERDYDKKTQSRDPTGCGIFGVFNTKQCFTETELKRMNVRSKYAALLCDYWADYLAFPDLIEKLRSIYRTKYGSPGRRPDIVLLEAEKTGISIRQQLLQYGVPTWGAPTRGQSKTMRAHAVSPFLLQGMLFVPESSRPERQGEFRDWAEPAIDQMCAFAGEGSVDHDEAIDVCSQAMQYLSERNTFSISPMGTKYPDPDEKEEADQKRAMADYEREKIGRRSYYGE